MTYIFSTKPIKVPCVDTKYRRIKTPIPCPGTEAILGELTMYGSDQAASVEPMGFRQLVGAVRKIEKAMGNGNRTINIKEIPIAKKLRAHIPFESHR